MALIAMFGLVILWLIILVSIGACMIIIGYYLAHQSSFFIFFEHVFISFAIVHY